MRVGQIRQFYRMQDEDVARSLSKCQRLMRAAMTQLNLSARLSSYPEAGAHDCRSGGCEEIQSVHLADALHLR